MMLADNTTATVATVATVSTIRNVADRVSMFHRCGASIASTLSAVSLSTANRRTSSDWTEEDDDVNDDDDNDDDHNNNDDDGADDDDEIEDDNDNADDNDEVADNKDAEGNEDIIDVIGGDGGGDNDEYSATAVTTSGEQTGKNGNINEENDSLFVRRKHTNTSHSNNSSGSNNNNSTNNNDDVDNVLFESDDENSLDDVSRISANCNYELSISVGLDSLKSDRLDSLFLHYSRFVLRSFLRKPDLLKFYSNGDAADSITRIVVRLFDPIVPRISSSATSSLRQRGGWWRRQRHTKWYHRNSNNLGRPSENKNDDNNDDYEYCDNNDHNVSVDGEPDDSLAICTFCLHYGTIIDKVYPPAAVFASASSNTVAAVERNMSKSKKMKKYGNRASSSGNRDPVNDNDKGKGNGRRGQGRERFKSVLCSCPRYRFPLVSYHMYLQRVLQPCRMRKQQKTMYSRARVFANSSPFITVFLQILNSWYECFYAYRRSINWRRFYENGDLKLLGSAVSSAVIDDNNGGSNDNHNQFDNVDFLPPTTASSLSSPSSSLSSSASSLSVLSHSVLQSDNDDIDNTFRHSTTNGGDCCGIGDGGGHGGGRGNCIGSNSHRNTVSNKKVEKMDNEKLFIRYERFVLNLRHALRCLTRRAESIVCSGGKGGGGGGGSGGNVVGDGSEHILSIRNLFKSDFTVDDTRLVCLLLHDMFDLLDRCYGPLPNFAVDKRYFRRQYMQARRTLLFERVALTRRLVTKHEGFVMMKDWLFLRDNLLRSTEIRLDLLACAGHGCADGSSNSSNSNSSSNSSSSHTKRNFDHESVGRKNEEGAAMNVGDVNTQNLIHELTLYSVHELQSNIIVLTLHDLVVRYMLRKYLCVNSKFTESIRPYSRQEVQEDKDLTHFFVFLVNRCLGEQEKFDYARDSKIIHSFDFWRKTLAHCASIAPNTFVSQVYTFIVPLYSGSREIHVHDVLDYVAWLCADEPWYVSYSMSVIERLRCIEERKLRDHLANLYDCECILFYVLIENVFTTRDDKIRRILDSKPMQIFAANHAENRSLFAKFIDVSGNGDAVLPGDSDRNGSSNGCGSGNGNSYGSRGNNDNNYGGSGSVLFDGESADDDDDDDTFIAGNATFALPNFNWKFMFETLYETSVYKNTVSHGFRLAREFFRYIITRRLFDCPNDSLSPDLIRKIDDIVTARSDKKSRVVSVSRSARPQSQQRQQQRSQQQQLFSPQQFPHQSSSVSSLSSSSQEEHLLLSQNHSGGDGGDQWWSSGGGNAGGTSGDSGDVGDAAAAGGGGAGSGNSRQRRGIDDTTPSQHMSPTFRVMWDKTDAATCSVYVDVLQKILNFLNAICIMFNGILANTGDANYMRTLGTRNLQVLVKKEQAAWNKDPLLRLFGDIFKDFDMESFELSSRRMRMNAVPTTVIGNCLSNSATGVNQNFVRVATSGHEHQVIWNLTIRRYEMAAPSLLYVLTLDTINWNITDEDSFPNSPAPLVAEYATEVLTNLDDFIADAQRVDALSMILYTSLISKKRVGDAKTAIIDSDIGGASGGGGGGGGGGDDGIEKKKDFVERLLHGMLSERILDNDDDDDVGDYHDSNVTFLNKHMIDEDICRNYDNTDNGKDNDDGHDDDDGDGCHVDAVKDGNDDTEGNAGDASTRKKNIGDSVVTGKRQRTRNESIAINSIIDGGISVSAAAAAAAVTSSSVPPSSSSASTTVRYVNFVIDRDEFFRLSTHIPMTWVYQYMKFSLEISSSSSVSPQQQYQAYTFVQILLLLLQLAREQRFHVYLSQEGFVHKFVDELLEASIDVSWLRKRKIDSSREGNFGCGGGIAATAMKKFRSVAPTATSASSSDAGRNNNDVTNDAFVTRIQRHTSGGGIIRSCDSATAMAFNGRGESSGSSIGNNNSNTMDTCVMEEDDDNDDYFFVEENDSAAVLDEHDECISFTRLIDQRLAHVDVSAFNDAFGITATSTAAVTAAAAAAPADYSRVPVIVSSTHSTKDTAAAASSLSSSSTAISTMATTTTTTTAAAAAAMSKTIAQQTIAAGTNNIWGLLLHDDNAGGAADRGATGATTASTATNATTTIPGSNRPQHRRQQQQQPQHQHNTAYVDGLLTEREFRLRLKRLLRDPNFRQWTLDSRVDVKYSHLQQLDDRILHSAFTAFLYVVRFCSELPQLDGGTTEGGYGNAVTVNCNSNRGGGSNSGGIYDNGGVSFIATASSSLSSSVSVSKLSTTINNAAITRDTDTRWSLAYIGMGVQVRETAIQLLDHLRNFFPCRFVVSKNTMDLSMAFVAWLDDRVTAVSRQRESPTFHRQAQIGRMLRRRRLLRIRRRYAAAVISTSATASTTATTTTTHSTIGRHHRGPPHTTATSVTMKRRKQQQLEQQREQQQQRQRQREQQQQDQQHQVITRVRGNWQQQQLSSIPRRWEKSWENDDTDIDFIDIVKSSYYHHQHNNTASNSTITSGGGSSNIERNRREGEFCNYRGTFVVGSIGSPMQFSQQQQDQQHLPYQYNNDTETVFPITAAVSSSPPLPRLLSPFVSEDIIEEREEGHDERVRAKEGGDDTSGNTNRNNSVVDTSTIDNHCYSSGRRHRQQLKRSAQRRRFMTRGGSGGGCNSGGSTSRVYTTANVDSYDRIRGLATIHDLTILSRSMRYSIVYFCLVIYIFCELDIAVTIYMIRLLVSYMYPGVESRHCTIVRGSSGSGKSQLFDLVRTFLNSASGILTTQALSTSGNLINTQFMPIGKNFLCQCDEPKRIDNETFKSLISVVPIAARAFQNQMAQKIPILAKLVITVNNMFQIESDDGILERLHSVFRLSHKHYYLVNEQTDMTRYNSGCSWNISHQFTSRIFPRDIDQAAFRWGMFHVMHHWSNEQTTRPDASYTLADQFSSMALRTMLQATTSAIETTNSGSNNSNSSASGSTGAAIGNSDDNHSTESLLSLWDQHEQMINDRNGMNNNNSNGLNNNRNSTIGTSSVIVTQQRSSALSSSALSSVPLSSSSVPSSSSSSSVPLVSSRSTSVMSPSTPSSSVANLLLTVRQNLERVIFARDFAHQRQQSQQQSQSQSQQQSQSHHQYRQHQHYYNRQQQFPVDSHQLQQSLSLPRSRRRIDDFASSLLSCTRSQSTIAIARSTVLRADTLAHLFRQNHVRSVLRWQRARRDCDFAAILHDVVRSDAFHRQLGFYQSRNHLLCLLLPDDCVSRLNQFFPAIADRYHSRRSGHRINVDKLVLNVVSGFECDRNVDLSVLPCTLDLNLLDVQATLDPFVRFKRSFVIEYSDIPIPRDVLRKRLNIYVDELNSTVEDVRYRLKYKDFYDRFETEYGKWRYKRPDTNEIVSGLWCVRIRRVM